MEDCELKLLREAAADVERVSRTSPKYGKLRKTAFHPELLRHRQKNNQGRCSSSRTRALMYQKPTLRFARPHVTL